MPMTMAFNSRVKSVVATVVVAADGSGHTTDIQTAINMLPDNGGVVYIREGTYDIDSTIVIDKPNVALMGAGKSTIITSDDDIDLISASNKSGLVFTDFYLYGSDSTYINQGLKLQNCDDCFINRVWFSKLDWPITFSGDRVIMLNNVFYDNKYAAITIWSVSNNCLISDNQFDTNGTHALSLADFNINRSMISNNQIYNCGQQGIAIAGSENVISNNIIKNSGKHAINIIYGDNTIITGNLIDTTGSGYDGIHLFNNNDKLVIYGNEIINCGGYGIGKEAGGSNSDNIAMGNMFDNNTNGDFQDVTEFWKVFNCRFGFFEVRSPELVTNVRFGHLYPMFFFSNHPGYSFNVYWDGSKWHMPTENGGYAANQAFDVTDGKMRWSITSTAYAPGDTWTTWAVNMTLDKNGNLGLATQNPTAKIDINDNTIRIRNTRTPSSASASGNKGDICWDSNYLYVCVDTNTWKRVALSSW